MIYLSNGYILMVICSCNKQLQHFAGICAGTKQHIKTFSKVLQAHVLNDRFGSIPNKERAISQASMWGIQPSIKSAWESKILIPDYWKDLHCLNLENAGFKKVLYPQQLPL